MSATLCKGVRLGGSEASRVFASFCVSFFGLDDADPGCATFSMSSASDPVWGDACWGVFDIPKTVRKVRLLFRFKLLLLFLLLLNANRHDESASKPNETDLEDVQTCWLFINGRR